MIIDLRSDVLTKPTKEMMEAMMNASMGDDVFEEEPTVKMLEKKVAAIAGKEAALFVASGTMANQLAIASMTSPHDEVILDARSHIFLYEQGAPAVISGVQLRPVEFSDSLPTEKTLESALRFPDVHHPISRLLCLEITHNCDGGNVPDLSRVKAVCKKARDAGLKIHIDGARIWNASVASGTPIKEYAALCDTMMFCFSKGLSAPVGSILAGTKEIIARARFLRKGLGGGWRKPGMLAAAAVYALDHNINRLAEDHIRAKKLAEAVKSNEKLVLANRVDTNMVFFKPKSADLPAYSEKLTSKGIIHSWRHFGAIRLVIYLGINDEMIDYAARLLKEAP